MYTHILFGGPEVGKLKLGKHVHLVCVLFLAICLNPKLGTLPRRPRHPLLSLPSLLSFFFFSCFLLFVVLVVWLILSCRSSLLSFPGILLPPGPELQASGSIGDSLRAPPEDRGQQTDPEADPLHV